MRIILLSQEIVKIILTSLAFFTWGSITGCLPLTENLGPSITSHTALQIFTHQILSALNFETRQHLRNSECSINSCLMNEWIKNYEHFWSTGQNAQEILHFYYALFCQVRCILAGTNFMGKWNFIVCMSGYIIFYLIRTLLAFRDNSFSFY